MEIVDQKRLTTSEVETADSKVGSIALFFVMVGALVALDQFTKHLVIRMVAVGKTIVVIPGFFNIVHLTNTGGAFSLFAAPSHHWAQYAFIGAGIAVTAAMAFACSRTRRGDLWTRVSYVCVAGGAVGNLIDRVRQGGEVTDFLAFHLGALYWPVFNVADAAISLGLCMVIVSMLQKK